MNRVHKLEEIFEEIERTANAAKFKQALQLVETELDKPIDTAKVIGKILKVKLICWLIDIGGESGDRSLVVRGLEMLELERDVLEPVLASGNYEFNLGNGYKQLFDLTIGDRNGSLQEDTIGMLLRAKTHYWKCYRALELSREKVKLDQGVLLVNLGNTLKSAGRIAEAIVYYDLAIEVKGVFPQAHFNRSEALISLWRFSGSCTSILIKQAKNGYQVALRDTKAFANAELCGRRLKWIDSIAKNLKVDDIHSDQEKIKTEEEYSAHSNYRKFCIQEGIALSEHAIYCGCAGSRQDNLTIPYPEKSIGGYFVPRMEFFLNRIKSEFSFTRMLYYQGIKSHSEWKTYDDEQRLTELYENERLGSQVEMLRFAFKNCFGILDKIAKAICELFMLTNGAEKVYFESFWNAKKGRKEKIFAVGNHNLMALYSIATDLNSVHGDWPEFKAWRNALEHGMLSVVGEGAISDPFQVYQPGMGDLRINEEDFRRRALLLIRLTHAAILSFVFCVREAVNNSLGGPGQTQQLRPRNN